MNQLLEQKKKKVLTFHLNIIYTVYLPMNIRTKRMSTFKRKGDLNLFQNLNEMAWSVF